MAEKKIVGTIDMTPTWRSVVEMTKRFTESGEHKAAEVLWDELRRLADEADYIREGRKLPERTPLHGAGH